MDPMRAFMEYLQTTLSGRLPGEVLSAIEAQAKELFAKFELVPRADYEAHMDILKSLEAQVATLEQRLKTLEDTSPN